MHSSRQICCGRPRANTAPPPFARAPDPASAPRVQPRQRLAARSPGAPVLRSRVIAPEALARHVPVVPFALRLVSFLSESRSGQ